MNQEVEDSSETGPENWQGQKEVQRPDNRGHITEPLSGWMEAEINYQLMQ